jgi:tRNA-Thr(GGU) m(6)t(6)A37 methyltransferase TsaA
MKPICLLTLSTGLLLAIQCRSEEETNASTEPAAGTNPFTMTFIGHVEKRGDRTMVRVQSDYLDGLLGLEKWSDIWVFYWFDRNDNPRQRSILQVHPRGNRDNPLTGVFACRSPVRPNLIAMSLCRVISIEGGAIEIEGIDAFDQTPVIDIKPYAPRIDRPKRESKVPEWAARQAGP